MKNTEKCPSLYNNYFIKQALVWPVLQGLVFLSSNMQAGSLLGIWMTGQSRVHSKLSPLSPGRVCIMATVNLSVFSVNSPHTGFTGGSLLNLQATPSNVLLTWLLPLPVKYTHFHFTHKYCFFKFLETLRWKWLLRTFITNKTYMYVLVHTTTEIFVTFSNCTQGTFASVTQTSSLLQTNLVGGMGWH